MTVPEVNCPTCGGAGELTECANDGTHGCSHIFDRAWPCRDCSDNHSYLKSWPNRRTA